MKQTCFFLILLAFNSTVYAQANSAATDSARSAQINPVIVQARFPGGPHAWTSFLLRNIPKMVMSENIAYRRKESDTIATVLVSFVVDSAGNISKVKLENPSLVDSKIAEKAAWVVQRGPLWIPATINGKKVMSRQQQSISFVVPKK